MARYLYTAVRMAFLTIVLVSVVYPLVLTGMAQLLWPRQARGSLVYEGATLTGSTLLGQSFTGPGYFHPRPSAAGSGYDALASGGSNLGPTSTVLAARVGSEVQRLRRENPEMREVPVDMVTTSASGLDPDITPASAFAQVPRVARARGLPAPLVRRLVEHQLVGRQFGLLGEPRLNVLRLNRMLDARP